MVFANGRVGQWPVGLGGMWQLSVKIGESPANALFTGNPVSASNSDMPKDALFTGNPVSASNSDMPKGYCRARDIAAQVQSAQTRIIR